MKKAAAVILILSMLLLSVPSVFAADATEGKCGNDLTWSYDKSTKTLVITGTGAMNNYYSNHKVPWRSIREEVEHISFPSGLTSIGDYAFYGFKNLKELSIPSTVKTIGNGTFSVCTSLKEITLPNGVRDLGGWVFASCTSLEKITIPSTVTSINYECFLNCPSLMDVSIPSGSVSLGVFSFGYNASHAYNYDMILRGVPGSQVQSYAANNFLNFVSIYASSSSSAAAKAAMVSESEANFVLTSADFDGDGKLSAKDILLSKKIG